MRTVRTASFEPFLCALSGLDVLPGGSERTVDEVDYPNRDAPIYKQLSAQRRLLARTAVVSGET
jgi:hypothetical protein